MLRKNSVRKNGLRRRRFFPNRMQASKGGKKATQTHKKISANVAAVASDSEDDNPASSNGSDSEEEVKK